MGTKGPSLLNGPISSEGVRFFFSVVKKKNLHKLRLKHQTSGFNLYNPGSQSGYEQDHMSTGDSRKGILASGDSRHLWPVTILLRVTFPAT